MKILYKQDGSIEKLVLSKFIQQNNNNVDEISVAIDGKLPEEYLVNVVFTLPNGDVNELLASTTKEIEFGAYKINGYSFYLTNAQTLYSGVLKMSLQIIDAEDTRKILFTYQTEFTINPSGVLPSEVNITQAEYNAIVEALNSKITPAVAWGAITGTMANQTDLSDSLENILEIAQGKSSTHVLSTTQTASWDSVVRFDTNEGFETEEEYNEYISGLTYANSRFASSGNVTVYNDSYLLFTTNTSGVLYIAKTEVLREKMKIGDIVLVTQNDYPDRWLAIKAENALAFYNLETRKIESTALYKHVMQLNYTDDTADYLVLVDNSSSKLNLTNLSDRVRDSVSAKLLDWTNTSRSVRLLRNIINSTTVEVWVIAGAQIVPATKFINAIGTDDVTKL